MSERKHSNSNINDTNSNWSEDDDWLDIEVITSSTSNEERLRNQVRDLKRVLDEKNLELMESNVQVDILKGHKILLENTKMDLRNDLSLQSAHISKLQEDLEASNQRVFELEESLHASRSVVQKTEQELKSCRSRSQKMMLEIERQQHLREEESRRASLQLRDASKNIEELNANLMAKDETIANRDACLTKLQINLQYSRDEQVLLENKTKSVQRAKDQLKQQADKITDDARAIAIVAENLRVDKQSLERKLQHNQGRLKQAENQVKVLDGSVAAMNQNETKLARKEQQQQEQNRQQAEDIKKLSDSLFSKTRELEIARNDVAKSAREVITTRSEAEEFQEALNRLKQQHEQFVAEQKYLHEEYAEREEALNLELARIKSANAKRLEELRQILGVRFHDILKLRSKKWTRSVAPGAPTAANATPSKIQKPAGAYIPPPILRTVMGLV